MVETIDLNGKKGETVTLEEGSNTIVKTGKYDNTIVLNNKNITAEIYLESSKDTLDFGAYEDDALEYERVEDDLVITFDQEESPDNASVITIKDYFKNYKKLKTNINIIGFEDDPIKGLFSDYVTVGTEYLVDKTGKKVTGSILGDEIIGEDMAELYHGNNGNDVIVGNDKNNKIYGDNGDDVVDGGKGNDTLYGGRGIDEVSGDAGNDLIYGNDQDDFLMGDEGQDTLYGGNHDDALFGDHAVVDSEDGTLVKVEKDTAVTPDPDIANSEYNDVLYGENGNDFLYGGYGDDLLNAGKGENLVHIDVTHTAFPSDSLVNLNSGNDTLVVNKDTYAKDTLSIQTENVGTFKEDIIWTKDAYNLVLSYKDDAGKDCSLTLQNYFKYNGKSSVDGTIYINPKFDFDNDEITSSDDSFKVTNTAKIQFTEADADKKNVIGGTFLDDVYTFNKGDGSYTLTLSKGTDKIVFNNVDGTTAADMFARDKNNLVIKYDGDQTITVKDFFKNPTKDLPSITEIDFVFEGETTHYDIAEYVKTHVVGVKDTTIKGEFFNDKITGNDLNNTIYGYANNDTLNGGKGNDKIYGGVGNDSILGGEGNDSLYGDDGDDVIEGNEGDDKIYSGEGNNTITGGAGNDYITLGSGENTVNLSAGNGVDTVVRSTKGGVTHYMFETDQDFETFTNNLEFEKDGNDLVVNYGDNNFVILKNYFSKSKYEYQDLISINGNLEEAFDIKEDGKIYYEGYYKKSNIRTSNIKDVVTGSAFNDSIYTYDDDDIVNAGDGADKVYGGNGNDTISGEDGNDSLYGDNGDDVINGGAGDDKIYSGEGNNTINAGNGNDLITLGNGENTINVLVGEGVDTIVRGTKGGTTHYVVDAEPDSLSYAKEGNNLIVKSNNSDLFVIKNYFAKSKYTYNDIISFAGSEDSIDINKDATVSYDFADSAKKVTVKASEYQDNVVGSAFDDVIYTYGGDDVINGGAGHDKIYSGEGNDTITGGAGNDLITLGSGESTVNLSLTDGVDTIVRGAKGGTTHYVIDSPDDLATFTDKLGFVQNKNNLVVQYDGKDLYVVQNYFASSKYEYQDIITHAQFPGTEIVYDKTTGGLSVVINSTKDNETINGSNINDVINVTNENIIVNAGKGNDTINGGAGNDVINGNEGDDVIVAGTGKNTIDGGVGNDTISGGTGNDTLSGGEGNDLIYSGAGNNQIISGEGKDRVILQSAENTVVSSLNEGSVTVVRNAEGGTTHYEIRDNGVTFDQLKQNLVYVKDGNDLVINYHSESIDATDIIDNNYTKNEIVIENYFAESSVEYNDIITLQGDDVNSIVINKNDFYKTNETNEEVITGGPSSTIIDAGAGNNQITTNDGNDNINAEAGDDVVNSGAGNDFINCGSGDDVVNAGTGKDIIKAVDGFNFINAQEGNDIIYGGKGTNIISTGLGDDVVHFENATNTVNDEGGNDIYIASDLTKANQITDNAGTDDMLFVDKSHNDLAIFFSIDNPNNIYVTNKEDFGKTNVGVNINNAFSGDSIDYINSQDGYMVLPSELDQIKADVTAWLTENNFASLDVAMNDATTGQLNELQNIYASAWQEASFG